MATVFMMVGIPGSGKSTFSKKFAKENNLDIISSDEVRNMHPDWEEPLIFPEVYRLIAEHLKNNQDVIYDATSPTPNVRHRLFDKLEPYNVTFDVGVYYFDTPYEVCYKRIEKRNNMPGERFFPLEKLKGFSDTIVEPTVSEGFKFVKKFTYQEDK